MKALRLYDELELLQPAFIDSRTGYRYYRPSQASRARAIALLRSLDMPLLEIKELLSESDPEKLRSRLESHRVTLELRVAEQSHMLRRVEQLMKRGELMSYEIEIKELEPARVVGVTFDTTPEAISDQSSKAYHQLYDALAAEKASPTGPPRLVYHRMDEDSWGIEACVPVAAEPSVKDGLEFREFPGGKAATTLHEGPYDELGIAWQELRRWMATHGHVTAAPPFDVYLNDPGEVEDPAKYLTELVWPIK